MSYRGREAVVLGLGLTGYSLARYLAARGANVRVADTRARPPFAAKLAAAQPGVPVSTGPIDDTTFIGADLIAISPGIARDQAAIAAAVARGVELVGDIELFARALPSEQKVLAITGSNGKTTVTALTGALCRAAGLATIVAGNIGDAVLDSLPDDRAWPDVFVLELSSFQLETTSSLAPTAATVLNVTDNHLDRYADIDAYARAKARIFAGGGIQVLNRDDPRSIAMRLAGRLVQTFGGGVPESEEAWGLVDRGAKRADTPEIWLARGGALLVPMGDLRLVGRHNALNTLAALALAAAVAKIDRRVLAAAAAFEGLPHRMQRIAEAGGVLFVNDSKGTTVAATSVALAGLDRPVVLIAGGDGKGQDFTPLRAAVAAHCRAVLLIGRDAPLIERAVAGSGALVERAGTLDAAVARAFGLARQGDAVLLSPACASLDQFADYVERGTRFVDLVRAHLGENAHA
ncbi:MAG TPA: UDP-N-acetylmuramoyl-L-alanine--D-glutamate ligase [Casimicrobiaceae bacterium]|nr:UDP-N-acetylmuramoyl-L-alanine--D-glutamate ligase [Casimicrobiaceae bacterium]